MLQWQAHKSSLRLNFRQDQKDPSRLGWSVANEQNAIALRNVDVERADNRIQEDDGTASSDTYEGDTTDGGPGHDSSCHLDVLTIAKDLPSSFDLRQWLYKTYTCTADLLSIRKSFGFVVQLRRQLNRWLRPQVPRDHVRLTWICVSTPL